MSHSAYQCAYSVRPAENGYIGSYEIMDEAGDVLETWIGDAVFPTPALALACAHEHARVAVDALAKTTMAVGGL